MTAPPDNAPFRFETSYNTRDVRPDRKARLRWITLAPSSTTQRTSLLFPHGRQQRRDAVFHGRDLRAGPEHGDELDREPERRIQREPDRCGCVPGGVLAAGQRLTRSTYGVASIFMTG